CFFFSSRRRHTRFSRDCSSDVCSSDLNAVPLVLPIGEEADFKGVVDLIKNRAIVWHEENHGSTFDIVDIPADMVDEVKKYRSQQIGRASCRERVSMKRVQRAIK